MKDSCVVFKNSAINLKESIHCTSDERFLCAQSRLTSTVYTAQIIYSEMWPKWAIENNVGALLDRFGLEFASCRCRASSKVLKTTQNQTCFTLLLKICVSQRLPANNSRWHRRRASGAASGMVCIPASDNPSVPVLLCKSSGSLAHLILK